MCTICRYRSGVVRPPCDKVSARSIDFCSSSQERTADRCRSGARPIAFIDGHRGVVVVVVVVGRYERTGFVHRRPGALYRSRIEVIAASELTDARVPRAPPRWPTPFRPARVDIVRVGHRSPPRSPGRGRWSADDRSD